MVVGDPRLRELALEVGDALPSLRPELALLHEVLAAFRQANGFGRAIAAPQIGIARRFIAMDLGSGRRTIVDPVVTWRSEESFELWDDCMSVPDRLVRVRRHRSISLDFRDEEGRPGRFERLPPDLSELLQHEIDHLDGILMLDRAIDPRSVRFRDSPA